MNPSKRRCLLQLGRRAAMALTAALVIALGVQPARATTIERVVSPGGIEAWLVRDSAVPMIAVEFGFLGGANQDPATKPGVASLTAALIDEGAGELSVRRSSGDSRNWR